MPDPFDPEAAAQQDETEFTSALASRFAGAAEGTQAQQYLAEAEALLQRAAQIEAGLTPPTDFGEAEAYKAQVSQINQLRQQANALRQQARLLQSQVPQLKPKTPIEQAMEQERLQAARLANRAALARLEGRGAGAAGGGLTQGQALNAQVQRDRMFQDALQSVMGNERQLLPFQVPEGLDYFPGYEPGGLGATLLGRLGANYDPEMFRTRPQALPAFEAAKRGVGL